MMTKQDYERAVQAIHQHASSNAEKVVLREVFVSFFRGDNPRFDTERFRAAVMRPFAGEV